MKIQLITNMEDWPKIWNGEDITNMITFNGRIFVGTKTRIYVLLDENEEWNGFVGNRLDTEEE